jgi:hypothetical protein
VSWTQTARYFNVYISAGLFAEGTGSQAGMAYLMTATGPGTTTASQIATASFVAPDIESYLTLFSNIELGPGTYYLLLTSGVTGSNCVCWALPSSYTYTHASDVTQNGYNYYSSSSPNPYPPANSFEFANGLQGQEPIYQVTGDADPLPEPGEWPCVALGLLLFVRKWKRSGPHQLPAVRREDRGQQA